jgi:26S proteasome regulatory subunit T4
LREQVRGLSKEYSKTEDDLKALQSVGQIIGDVLKQLDDERFIVKASSGPRYVVGCRNKLEKNKLKAGTRVSMDMTTLTIMRQLPREVDPNVYHMLHDDAGGISFSSIGGELSKLSLHFFNLFFMWATFGHIVNSRMPLVETGKT